MSVLQITQDPQTGYAYISLAEMRPGIVAESIELEKQDQSDPDGLESLVLDFDSDGRLVGIEVLGRAEDTLRPEILGM